MHSPAVDQHCSATYKICKGATMQCFSRAECVSPAASNSLSVVTAQLACTSMRDQSSSCHMCTSHRLTHTSTDAWLVAWCAAPLVLAYGATCLALSLKHTPAQMHTQECEAASCRTKSSLCDVDDAGTAFTGAPLHSNVLSVFGR